ncbi:YaaC family protein [Streptomyces sp. NBC_00435]|uniref:YaaC family protein n=1 Tax=Streptomyces sp. NBC_00435 TaxID=2903649 RepID=UPI003FA7870A
MIYMCSAEIYDSSWARPGLHGPLGTRLVVPVSGVSVGKSSDAISHREPVCVWRARFRGTTSASSPPCGKPPDGCRTRALGSVGAATSEPAGPPGGGARRSTCAAALERAEQMFRAATVVRSATRPLQVFYGLRQAGRAIAAAAVDYKGTEQRLVGGAVSRRPASMDPSPTWGSAPAPRRRAAVLNGWASCRGWVARSGA